MITGYQVGSNTYLGSEPNDVVVNMEEVGPNVFRKLLENQEPEKSYAVKLQAKTSIGWGDEVTRTTRTVKWAGKFVSFLIDIQKVPKNLMILPL